jgi:hypothetical protein
MADYADSMMNLFPGKLGGKIMGRLLAAAVLSVLLTAACSTLTNVVHDVEREAQAEDRIDSRFPESDGIITDSITGLQWQVGPDRDTDWMAASLWVENLHGSGWRMPSKHELLGLHDAGLNWHNLGPFDNDGQSVWSDSTSPHGANAWLYDFMVESGSMANTGESAGNRAFAVRSLQQ